MRKPTLKETAAVGLSVAFIGGGFALTAKEKEALHRARQAEAAQIAKDTEAKRDVRLNGLMRRTVIKAGNMILQKAIDDGAVDEISPDKSVKDGVLVAVTARDGEQGYGAIAGMLLDKDGTPDPSTTYEVLVDKYYPGTNRIAEGSTILGGGALGGKNWNEVYKAFSKTGAKRVTSEFDTITAGADFKAAQDVANILRLEADLISVLPSDNNIQPPNSITV